MPARPDDPDWLKEAYADGRIMEGAVTPTKMQAHLSAWTNYQLDADAHRMIKVSEDAFQQEVIELARFHGWYCAHFRNVRIARSDGTTYWACPVQSDGEGFPDLVLLRDRVIYAELKSEVGNVSEKQDVWLNKLITANQEVYVWRPSDWNEIVKVLSTPMGNKKVAENAVVS